MTTLADRCKGLLDGPVLAAWLGIPDSTLRWWASEGLIRRHGTDANGCTLYDVGEVGKLAKQRRRLTKAS